VRPGPRQGELQWHPAYRTLAAPAARIEKRPILTRVVGKKTSAAGSKPVRRTGERRGLVEEHSGPSSWKCLLFILALRECQNGYEIGSVPRQAVRKCKDSVSCMAGIDGKMPDTFLGAPAKQTIHAIITTRGGARSS